MQHLFSDTDEQQQTVFTTDYKTIVERMQQVDAVRYAKTRNYLNGAVTYLSPYISRGVISVKQLQQLVLSKGYAPYQIEKFLQELAWREYFQRVWQAKGAMIGQDLKQPQQGVLHYHMVKAVAQASTGIDSIDEQLKKLYATGYLHNHTRMYVAAITCNIAGAHWLQPAKWMYYHLLDADAASNNCSWQWVSGAFASKKYYCNQENINKYTGAIQQNSFLQKTYEEISSMPVPEILKETTELQLQTVLPATPLPAIDVHQPTLLYNSYNIDPLWRKEETANRVLLLEPSHFSQYPVSEKTIQFICALAANIPGIILYCGAVEDLVAVYEAAGIDAKKVIISKEHPAFSHYPGIKDSRDWIYPEVSGYHPSFFSYWKKCEKYLKKNY